MPEEQPGLSPDDFKDYASGFERRGKRDLARLFQYVWSRTNPALTPREEFSLANELEDGNTRYIREISNIIEIETSQGRPKAEQLIESFRKEIKSTSEKD